MDHSPRLLAHRGIKSDRAPENTLASIQNALDAGIEIIETDVRCTADGIAVLMHDKNFRRVAKSKIKINQLSYDQAKQIDLGGGAHVISLADALAWFPKAQFNIDVKSEDAIFATALAINGTKSWNRVLIASFSESRRRRTVAFLDENVKTSPGASLVVKILLASLLPNQNYLRRLVDGLTALQVPTRYAFIRLDSQKIISKMHSVGIEVHYWVVNTPQVALRLQKIGADALVTDEVQALRSALK